ncbi:MAG: hypothetical protein WCO03_00610 [bacterium]
MIKKYLSLALAVLVLTMGLSYVFAWDQAPDDPPSCDTSILGCNPPINVSGTTQFKDGKLGVNELYVFPGGAGEGGQITLIDSSAHQNSYFDNFYGLTRLFGDNGKIYLGVRSAPGRGDKDVVTVDAKLRIIDGTQGAGKVLTSDAGGNASWQSGSIGGLNCAVGQIVVFDASGAKCGYEQWHKGESCGGTAHNTGANVPCRVNGVDVRVNNGPGDDVMHCPAGFSDWHVHSDNGGAGLCICNQTTCGDKR